MKQRLHLLDTLRGITIISMILFHAFWDMVYLGFISGGDPVHSTFAIIWERSICCSFIIIAGICHPLGRRNLRQGVLLLALGALITLITSILLPDAPAIFGVLHLLGLCRLICHGGGKLFSFADHGGKAQDHRTDLVLMILSFFLFLLTYDIPTGRISLAGHTIYMLPRFLYSGLFMTMLGFKDPGFYSSDYFPLMPWLFLYMTGLFAGRLLQSSLSTSNKKTPGEIPAIYRLNIRPLSFLGRHSLLVYVLHQPVVFGILSLIKTCQ